MVSRLEPVAFHLWRAVGLVRLRGVGSASGHLCVCVCVCVETGRHKYAAAETTPDMQGTQRKSWQCTLHDWSAPRACLVSNV